MKFYDLHIHSNLSSGENNIKQITDFAEKLGFTGIGVCDTWENLEKIKKLKDEISKTESKINIFPGVLIQAKDPIEMKQIVDKVREHVLVVIVHGGDYKINRAACENPKVDILAHPEFERIDNGLDDICVKSAAANNVAIQINFKNILSTYRKPRSRALDHVSQNIRLCTHFKTPIIICSGAHSIWDMRDPRELIALGNVLGMDLGRAFSSLTDIPHNIFEDNKKKLEGKIITKGVEVVK